MRNRTLLVLTSAALASLLACTGGGSPGPGPEPPKVRAISYSEPAAETGFRFVRNAALSTSTHLVLDLVASGQATASNGLAFDVSLGSTGLVAWAKVAAADAAYVRNGAVFEMGSAPAGLAAKVAAAQLQAVVGQKGVGASKDLNSGVLASVALDLASGSATGAASFTVNKFQIIPGSRAITTIPNTSVSFGTVTVTSS